MHLDSAFRLSFYATVVLAFACLGLAELWFLPWIPGLLIMAAILIGAAYRLEGRWVLPERWANRLGIGIALATVLWVSLQVPRSDADLIAGGIPWPAGLLPHVGPLLMILLLVKLFRPKSPADVWVIHAIGLMMVLLGCVLTGDFTFGFLLVAYLACLLWNMSIYYQVRGSLMPAAQVSEFGRVPWRLLGVGKAFALTATAFGFALVVFLSVPRQGTSQWDPTQLSTRTRGRVISRTGLEASMDSARTGKVEVVNEVAFTVEADDARGPKGDLDLTMRWRGVTLDYYMPDGRWRVGSPDAVKPRFLEGIQPSNRTLPSLDINEYFLNIRFEIGKGEIQVLADPPLLGPADEHPYVVLQPLPPPRFEGFIPFLFKVVPGSGTFQPTPKPVMSRPREYLYRQVVVPQASPDMFAATGVSDEYRTYLLEQIVPAEVRRFTTGTLLTLDDLTDVDLKMDAQGRLASPVHAPVARALTSHLATSGVFGYSLVLERSDKKIDPTVDFLINVKKGHCERYAGSLALMLRSIGIPARVVKGYRGAENNGDNEYIVRQNQAHAWVEAIVPDDGNAGQWNWLVLDPTPASETDEGSLDWLTWLSVQWRDTRTAWRNFVLEYDGERQQAAVRDLWKKLTRRDRMAKWTALLRGAGAAAGVLLVIFLARKAYKFRSGHHARRASAVQPQPAFYKRFLDAVNRYQGLRPELGQTPVEFAHKVTQALSHAQATAFGELPRQVVRLLYRIRFGGETLGDSEVRDIEKQVNALTSALKLAKCVPAG